MVPYFSHVFCINLDRRLDRWADARDELARCGLAAERFAAIVPPPDAPMGPVSGCLESHRAIWRRAASGECGERILILEDDFLLTTRELLVRVGFQQGSDVLAIFDSCPGATFHTRFSAMLPYVPARWDLLYLGGGYQCPPRARLNRHVISNRGMLTTHAYAITPAFAAHVTKRLDEGSIGGGSDSVLAALAKDETVLSYTLTPRLFIQRPTSPSDIDPKPPGFEWSLTDAAHEMMVPWTGAGVP